LRLVDGRCSFPAGWTGRPFFVILPPGKDLRPRRRVIPKAFNLQRKAQAMTRDEILPELYKIIREIVNDPPELRPETDFGKDLGLDSLAVMRMLEQVEDRFDVLVPINMVSDIRTLGDFAEQLIKLLAEEN
jgi:acyl carrier protein